MRVWYSRALQLALGATLAASANLRADTVRLDNGAIIEGIVVSRTAAEVVLEVGTGTMRIPARTVAGIEPGSSAAHAALRQGWARRHYLHRKYVPEGMQDLASSFRALAAQHEEALRTRAEILRARQGREDLVREADALVEALAARSAALRGLDPSQDTDAYNALVREANTLNADLALRRRRQNDAAQSREKDAALIAAYLNALPAFQKTLDERRADAARKPENDPARAFLERISAETAALAAEISRVTVPLDEWRGGRLLTVTVNDRLEGRFILDTGASLVSISEAFARRLGLDPAQGREVELRLADGRAVKGRAVLLSAVSLREARAEDVPAVILDNSPAPAADGLLGMTFLARFVMRLNGVTGELTLEEFRP